MSIDEVSKLLNISKSQLRFYEKLHIINPIMRDNSGKRDYSEKDLLLIKLLLFLKKLGMPLKDINEFIELKKEGDVTLDKRKKKLEELLMETENVILEKIESKKILENLIQSDDLKACFNCKK